MATARKTKAFGVTCPFCNDPDAGLRIDLNDLQSCQCTSCEEEFSPAAAVAKVAEQLARWQAVARWVEMAGECTAE